MKGIKILSCDASISFKAFDMFSPCFHYFSTAHGEFRKGEQNKKKKRNFGWETYRLDILDWV